MKKEKILEEINKIQREMHNIGGTFPTGYLKNVKKLIKLYEELNKIENIWNKYIEEYKIREKELEEVCKEMGIKIN